MCMAAISLVATGQKGRQRPSCRRGGYTRTHSATSLGGRCRKLGSLPNAERRGRGSDAPTATPLWGAYRGRAQRSKHGCLDHCLPAHSTTETATMYDSSSALSSSRSSDTQTLQNHVYSSPPSSLIFSSDGRPCARRPCLRRRRSTHRHVARHNRRRAHGAAIAYGDVAQRRVEPAPKST